MNNTIKRTWNQGSLVNIEDLRGMTFQAESGGHTFVISAVDADGNAVAMSGTPAGTMLRPDNTDQALTCSISGGNVYATLPAGCYDVPGRAGITIFLTSGGQKTAIYAAVVSVTRTQSGTASPGTTASVVDLINAINTAISGIPATDTALKAAMAPTYSNSALYAVGDYAWYNGTLYRCTTAITTAETWTSGHWTTAAIGTDSANELRGLKSAFENDAVVKDMMQKCELVEVPASANKWNTDAALVGFLHTNGSIYTGGSYDNYRYESIGAVSEGDVITTWKYTNNTVAAQPAQMIVAYDANGNVLPSAGKSSVSSYTVPSGVATISVTFNNSQVVENVMVIINGDTPTGYIPYQEASSYYVATKEFLPVNGIVLTDGVKQVTPQNTQFMFYSSNLFDEDAVTDGYFVNQVTGELNVSAANSVSDWIPVVGNTDYVISLKLSRQLRYCWYNANKVFISGQLTSGDVTELEIESPTNAAFIRFSTTGIYTALIQFEEGSSASEYSKYGTSYLLPQYAPPVGDMFLNLPSKIYALVGYELNIYFENITENWEDYTWDVSCAKGMQLERGYRVTPETADVGTYPLVIIAKNGSFEVSATANLIVTSASAGSGDTASLIVLGDSTTASGIAITKLNENFSDDVMSISTLGTRGSAPNNHEGRSGWTFNAYFNPPNAADIALGIENPFYNPTAQTFDASYYFTNSGVSIPTWFFINLGINDTFSYTNDSALETAIITIKGLCDNMIASLKLAAPNMKIGLCLTIPPNDSQDAFGKAYKTMQTRDRYKRNNFIWVHELIKTYSNRETENIYLVPIFTNLDTVYNMGLESNLVNSRNSITYKSPIGNGGVHPAESGYWQIADVYTAFLKAHAND